MVVLRVGVGVVRLAGVVRWDVGVPIGAVLVKRLVGVESVVVLSVELVVVVSSSWPLGVGMITLPEWCLVVVPLPGVVLGVITLVGSVEQLVVLTSSLGVGVTDGVDVFVEVLVDDDKGVVDADVDSVLEVSSQGSVVELVMFLEGVLRELCLVIQVDTSGTSVVSGLYGSVDIFELTAGRM